MNGFNDKGLKKGPWESYHSNGKLAFKVTYVNGKEHGLYEYYDTNNVLRFCTIYKHGNIKGIYSTYGSDATLYKIEYYL
jgi:antitoxin component YwqK of YwqJK toxin-antitoxin module